MLTLPHLLASSFSFTEKTATKAWNWFQRWLFKQMEHEFPFGTSRPEKRTAFSGCSVPLGNFPLEWHPIHHFLKKERGWVGRGQTFTILFQEGGDWYLMFLWASCLPNNNSNRKFDVSLVGALVSHQEWFLVSHNESECLCFNSCCSWRSTFYESVEEKRE